MTERQGYEHPCITVPARVSVCDQTPCPHRPVHELSSSCPECEYPQRGMRGFVAYCDNGHYWDRRATIDPAPRGPQVVGEPAADRLMRSLDYRLHPNARHLTREEVAVVLSALADHTALEAARVYDRNERRWPGDDGPAVEARFWPTSTSIGRWLHDTADQLRS